MFIEENMKVCAIDNDGKTYSGNIYKIVIQPDDEDGNRPHALLFISQDKENIEQNGEFGCAALWVDKLKSIDILSTN